jgi:hypothetical protein
MAALRAIIVLAEQTADNGMQAERAEVASADQFTLSALGGTSDS